MYGSGFVCNTSSILGQAISLAKELGSDLAPPKTETVGEREIPLGEVVN